MVAYIEVCVCYEFVPFEESLHGAQPFKHTASVCMCVCVLFSGGKDKTL